MDNAEAQISQVQTEKKVRVDNAPPTSSADILKLLSPKATNRSGSGTAEQVRGVRKVNSRQGSKDEVALTNNLAHLIQSG